jgi:predicted AlkP superfamily pyrophosphatase or phosphodiesterase
MKITNKIYLYLLSASTLLIYWGCVKDYPVNNRLTKNVILVVVDGARYSETWGEPSHRFIPFRSAFLQQGVLCNNFHNNGITFTNPGHTAICTGYYQDINNAGAEYPLYPSLFQQWLKTYQRDKNEAWIITTKDKLEVLSDCSNTEWKGTYRPQTDCGINGLGTGYREDSTTYKKVKSVLVTHHPRLMLVNFKQPDAAGHSGDSLAYLKGISDTDYYISQLWNLIQSDDFYKNRTTLIVTNDHGRHTAGHLDGFVSHGDGCDGCRHVEFFALGPDFKQNYICTKPYQQIDITNTIGELMKIDLPYSKGKVMDDIFK